MQMGYCSNTDCRNPPQALVLKGNDFHFIFPQPCPAGAVAAHGSSRQPGEAGEQALPILPTGGNSRDLPSACWGWGSHVVVPG